MDPADGLIGRVTRCSTRGFVGAMRLPEAEIPTFGSFCFAEAQRGHSQVIGLIYDLSVADDELARQLAAAENVPSEQIADSQRNRQVPVEISALAVGYVDDQGIHHRLPPQPPLTLSPIRMLPASELRDFTEQLDFLPLVLSAESVPIDSLLAAALTNAAAVRPAGQRRAYLVGAARQCASLLATDLDQLTRLLQALGPVAAAAGAARG
ncbi:MAG: hypothetical protein WBR18_10025 [Anaerolineales bacterium]